MLNVETDDLIAQRTYEVAAKPQRRTDVTADGATERRGSPWLVTSPSPKQPAAAIPALVEAGLAVLAADRPLALRANDTCPRCDEPDGRLTLLTSMVRYYVCAQCERPWQVVRQ